MYIKFSHFDERVPMTKMQLIQCRAPGPTQRTRWAAPYQTSRISPNSPLRVCPPPWPSLSASTLAISPVLGRLGNNKPSGTSMKTIDLFFCTNLWLKREQQICCSGWCRTTQGQTIQQLGHTWVSRWNQSANQMQDQTKLNVNKEILYCYCSKARQSILNWHTVLDSGLFKYFGEHLTYML